jgi:hypothetical protein
VSVPQPRPPLTGSSGPGAASPPRDELPFTAAELITHWGEAYEIVTGGRCRARRRDGQGGWLEADDPDALYVQIRDDYRRERVPRDYDPPAAR